MGSRGYEKRLSLLESSLKEHKEVARLNNTYDSYKNIVADTMLLYGEKGERSAPATAKALSMKIPTSQVKMFSKLDHFGINEKGYQEVADVIKYFLSP
jgi:hypothetical protein